MIRTVLCSSFLALLSLVVLAAPAARAQENVDTSGGNVIFVTLDGVRWQEVFRGDENGAPIFVHLLSEDLGEGIIYGNMDKGTAMQTSNRYYVSLPAYQSMMAGVPQSCATNSCGRIGVETVQERALRELALDRSQVATIASWDTIRNAVEHVEGTTFVNASVEPLDDGTFDPETQQINEAQAKDTPPWESARFDRYTWMHAMHYLQKHRPKFLYISLDDSDERGHRNEWSEYVASLKQYDQWIHELIQQLKVMGEYGARTTLIVTTDHGRGEGSNWTSHGFLWPSSKNIWLFARPSTNPLYDDGIPTWGEDFDGYTHSDIRPTIEAALGLAPQTCNGCGRIIKGAVR